MPPAFVVVIARLGGHSVRVLLDLGAEGNFVYKDLDTKIVWQPGSRRKLGWATRATNSGILKQRSESTISRLILQLDGFGD
jgi:hypothetical protein